MGRERKAGPVRIEVKIDRVLKQRWDETIGRLQESLRRGASAFDELWESVDAIINHDPPLYLAGGIATAEEFLRRYTQESVRTAQRFMRVARYASPAEEQRYTVSKLDAAIAYVEAKAGGAFKGRVPVDFGKLKIPVKRKESSARVPLEDATVEEVQAATRGLLRDGKKPHPSASPVVVALSRALTSGPLKQVSVRFQSGKVWLGGIPLAAFSQAMGLLARVKLPRS